MDSPRLSKDNNKKINILILIILSIVIFIYTLLLVYKYGIKDDSQLFNNIITVLTYIFIILSVFTSFLYIAYRYNFGDNIVDNIDIIIKPIMYISLSVIVASIFLFSKNNIYESKNEINKILNMSVGDLLAEYFKNK
uniref:Uncharacterized protein n=1 Tax=viral metagenome TaxID=1070528 RepID=A0A6C0HVJ5_9ZZZZ